MSSSTNSLRLQIGRIHQTGCTSLIVVSLRLETALFPGGSHLTKYEDRERGHPPPLVRVECLIERLPRIRQLLKVSPSLSQGIGALMQEGDGITVAHGFKRTAVTQFIQ